MTAPMPSQAAPTKLVMMVVSDADADTLTDQATSA